MLQSRGIQWFKPPHIIVRPPRPDPRRSNRCVKPRVSARTCLLKHGVTRYISPIRHAVAVSEWNVLNKITRNTESVLIVLYWTEINHLQRHSLHEQKKAAASAGRPYELSTTMCGGVGPEGIVTREWSYDLMLVEQKIGLKQVGKKFRFDANGRRRNLVQTLSMPRCPAGVERRSQELTRMQFTAGEEDQPRVAPAECRWQP
jgi:hypothetical protein